MEKLNLVYKIILGVIFLLQSYSKLSGVNTALYAKWGIEGKQLIALGVVELLLGLLIFSPYTHYVTIFMLLILAGAYPTLIKHSEPITRFITPTIALISIVLLSGKNWSEWFKGIL